MDNTVHSHEDDGLWDGTLRYITLTSFDRKQNMMGVVLGSFLFVDSLASSPSSSSSPPNFVTL